MKNSKPNGCWLSSSEQGSHSLYCLVLNYKYSSFANYTKVIGFETTIESNFISWYQRWISTKTSLLVKRISRERNFWNSHGIISTASPVFGHKSSSLKWFLPISFDWYSARRKKIVLHQYSKWSVFEVIFFFYSDTSSDFWH